MPPDRVEYCANAVLGTPLYVAVAAAPNADNALDGQPARVDAGGSAPADLSAPDQ